MSGNLRDLMRRRRHELGISQEEVAERIGMSQEWTSKLERGGNKRALRTDVMILLADALEVPFDEIAVAAGITRTHEAARRILEKYYTSLDTDALVAMPSDLAEHWAVLDDEERQHVIDTARLFASRYDVTSSPSDTPTDPEPTQSSRSEESVVSPDDPLGPSIPS